MRGRLRGSAASVVPGRLVEQGRGPAVVLIHGVGLDRSMWDAQAAHLARRFRVLRYDLLGHGDTPAPAVAPGLDAYVAQLDTLLQRAGIEHASLVGFSMGALVAREFARRRGSRLQRLVLISCVHARSPAQREAVRERLRQARAEGPRSIVDAALARWFTPAFRAANPQVVAAVAQRLRRNDPAAFLAAYRVFAEAEPVAEDELARLRVPTLVLTGGDDPGSTPAMARALANAIPGARLLILPGVRHLLPLEAAPALNRALDEFLAAAAQGTAHAARPAGRAR